MARRTIFCGNVRQNTDRIDRTARCCLFAGFLAVDTELYYRPRRRLYRPQFMDIDRVSTVKDLLGLQVFHLLNDSRGRCGRYVNDLYGYIDIVQVNEGCYQAIFEKVK